MQSLMEKERLITYEVVGDQGGIDEDRASKQHRLCRETVRVACEVISDCLPRSIFRVSIPLKGGSERSGARTAERGNRKCRAYAILEIRSSNRVLNRGQIDSLSCRIG